MSIGATPNIQGNKNIQPDIQKQILANEKRRKYLETKEELSLVETKEKLSPEEKAELDGIEEFPKNPHLAKLAMLDKLNKTSKAQSAELLSLRMFPGKDERPDAILLKKHLLGEGISLDQLKSLTAKINIKKEMKKEMLEFWNQMQKDSSKFFKELGELARPA